MSQCPFWSTNKDKFGCYNECPMQGSSEEKDCVFKEMSSFSKINLNDIINKDSTYNKDELYMDGLEYLSNF